MKVLITNQYIFNRAGSEIFTVSLALSLQQVGHEVYIYTTAIAPDIVAPAESVGVIVTDDIHSISHIDFDIIHAQHNVVAMVARSVFNTVPMVYMSHGVIPKLEQPPSIDIGISKYIVVSEEVRDHLTDNYNIKDDDISVIYNFIDSNVFNCKNAVHAELKHILVISNHYKSAVRKTLEQAAQFIGATVSHVGLPDNPVADVTSEIGKADLVVTLGRGVLEAGACSRNVLVYDMHGLDGVVTGENFHKLRSKNFSGRMYAQDCSVEGLISELRKYDPINGIKLRRLIIKEHSKESIVSEIISVYNNAIEHPKVNSSRFWEHNNILHSGFKSILREQTRLDRYRSILHSSSILQLLFSLYKRYK